MIMGLFIVNPFVAISQESIGVPTPHEVTPVESATSTLDELARDPRMACLRLPSRLITEDASDSFQNISQVDRIVLGTHAKGTAVCKGEVRGELRDRANGVEIVCFISGTVTSQTCGVNGPAVINSTSDTTYTAEKRILFNGRQLSTQPAIICATTRVQITGIGSTAPRLRGRVVIRVATRRAAESLPEAQAITRQLTVNELQQHIDAEFETRLASLNRKLAQRLSMLDAFSRKHYKVSICSRTEFIEILLTQKQIVNEEPALPKSVHQKQHKPLPTFPTSEDAVLWIQLPDVSLTGLDPIAVGGLIHAKSYLPAWLSTSLSNAKAELDARTPRIKVVCHENWIGFQFNHDLQHQ
jgi:hypothetical protein